MRKYFSVLVCIGLAISGCNQSDSFKNKIIYGLWEYRFSYNEFENEWEELNTPYWSFISKGSHKERLSRYSNSDSLCYLDWTVIDNSSELRSWSIVGDDSATAYIYWDTESSADDFIATFKAYEDTLICYVSYKNEPVTISKAIKIDSFDFSPVCSD